MRARVRVRVVRVVRVKPNPKLTRLDTGALRHRVKELALPGAYRRLIGLG